MIPVAPTAFKADGKWQLVYELHVSNLWKWDCELTRIEVLDANGGQKPLASFSGAELDGMVVHYDGDASQKSKIGPTQFAVVYLWATFDTLDAVPASISHRVTAKIGDYPEAFSVDIPRDASGSKAGGGDQRATDWRGLGGRKWSFEYFGTSARADSG